MILVCCGHHRRCHRRLLKVSGAHRISPQNPSLQCNITMVRSRASALAKDLSRHTAAVCQLPTSHSFYVWLARFVGWGAVINRPARVASWKEYMDLVRKITKHGNLYSTYRIPKLLEYSLSASCMKEGGERGGYQNPYSNAAVE